MKRARSDGEPVVAQLKWNDHRNYKMRKINYIHTLYIRVSHTAGREKRMGKDKRKTTRPTAEIMPPFCHLLSSLFDADLFTSRRHRRDKLLRIYILLVFFFFSYILIKRGLYAAQVTGQSQSKRRGRPVRQGRAAGYIGSHCIKSFVIYRPMGFDDSSTAVHKRGR